MSYSNHEGSPSAWPTGFTTASGVFDVPVYRGCPAMACGVMGFNRFDSPNVDWNDGDLKQAAQQAKAAGGDALILIPKGADPSPKMVALRQQLGLTDAQIVGMIVKWK